MVLEWVKVRCLGISLLKISVMKVISEIVRVVFILCVYVKLGIRFCS